MSVIIPNLLNKRCDVPIYKKVRRIQNEAVLFTLI
jgi:hypothetical protein